MGKNTKQLLQRHKGILIFLGVLAVILISILIWIFAAIHIKCNAVRDNGQITQARVTSVTPYRPDGGIKSRVSPGVPTTIENARKVVAEVTFTANGKTYNQTIVATYDLTDYLRKLYNMARTGTLQVRYAANDPTNVRPAFETEPGAPAELCTSQ